MLDSILPDVVNIGLEKPRSSPILPSPRLVAAARTLAGATQEELAVEARVGLATLQRYETGKQQARAVTLNRILRALRERGIRFLDETGECEMGVMLVKDRTR